MTSGSNRRSPQLPRLHEGRRKAKPIALSHFLHLGTHGGDLADLETLRRRKMMKTTEQEGGLGASLTVSAGKANQTKETPTISPKSASTKVRLEPMATASRSTQCFN